MKAAWSGVALAIVVVAASAGDEKPTPAKTVAELKKEAEVAQREMIKKYEALGEGEEANKTASKLFEDYAKAEKERFTAAIDIAKADPKADSAWDALEWLLTTPSVYYTPTGATAMKLATEHFAESPKVGKVILTLGRFAPPDTDPNGKAAAAFLKAVSSNNKDRTVLAQLAIVKGWKAKSAFERAEYQKAKDADELATVAVKAFEEAVKEYGNEKLLGRGEDQTIASAAEVELFELRNLRVGKTAPDIEGEDLDGTKFKLSDYKGKVVVLDFWGDW